MPRLMTRALVGGLAVFAAIQLVRPERTNPPVDPSCTLQAQLGSDTRAASVVARACRDCHSNETNWPWYSRVAPVSWLVAHDVAEGREEMNFSIWSEYPPEKQHNLLKNACDEVRAGEMPIWMYTLMHREAKLSSDDVSAVCDLARPALVQSPQE